MSELATPSVAFAPGDDIVSIIRRIAQEAPGRIALIHGAETLSWGELSAKIDGGGTSLAELGVRPGDRVAILAENSIAYVEAFFGVLAAGGAAVPLQTLASPEALARMMDDSGATALFASAAYRGVAETVSAGRAVTRIALDFDAEGWQSHRALSRRAPATLPPPVLGVGDAFDVIYSSGTTGVPKGIVHSHGARKASYGGSRAAYFDAATVNVVATPFYSNTTCITWLLTTARGGTNVILGKFSPEAFIDAVAKHQATHAMIVPVQYERILGSPAFAPERLASLRYLFSTSAPLRAEVKRRVLDELTTELVEIYGLTEGGSVTVLDARKHPTKLASVGVPAPGCELRVIDEAGKDVPPGQAGEVIGRSSNMMSGYLNRPDETRAMVLEDPSGKVFFRSGDIGRLDADGFLYLLDRKKDVIISGGFNVYATDLEAVLAVHPAVLEVTVIGVPSEQWGETPLALVVADPSHPVTPAELSDYVNARVGKAQRLSAVELRTELPKNAIGKVLKRELREPYWKAKGAAI